MPRPPLASFLATRPTRRLGLRARSALAALAGFLALTQAAAQLTGAAQPADPVGAPAAVPAPITASSEAVWWTCGLSANLLQLVCAVDTNLLEPSTPEEMDRQDPREQAPPPSAAQRAALASAAPTATVRGTRFPLDPTRRWFVDLWTPPTDAASLEFLARATICYRSPGCKLRMQPLPQLR